MLPMLRGDVARSQGPFCVPCSVRQVRSIIRAREAGCWDAEALERARGRRFYIQAASKNRLFIEKHINHILIIQFCLVEPTMNVGPAPRFLSWASHHG